MKKIILSIEGMTCSACSNGLEKYLNKQKGIKQASVNLVLANASIEYDEKILTVDQLNEFVKKAGFKSLGEFKEIKIESKNKKEKRKFIFFTVLAIIFMYIAMGHMIHLPTLEMIDPSKNPIGYTICLFIFAILFFIYGFDVLKNGYKNLIHRTPNMDTLVGIGVLSSFLYSIYSMVLIIRGDTSAIHHLYFESAAMVIYFVKLGRYLDGISKDKTKEAIQKLVKITPEKATIKVDGKEKIVTIDEVHKGDIVVSRPGERISVDGEIIEGKAHLDESFITGESKPVTKDRGAKVIAGSINYDGYIEYKAEKIGRESTISEIVKLVVEASNTKAPIAKMADIVSSYFVPIVMIIAILSFLLYLILGYDFASSLIVFVTILVVACPCSLGLATPLAIVVSEGKCANHGILVKSSEILENAQKINTVVFDKTGTLTYGTLKISEIKNYSKMENNELLQLIGSIERKSTHPIGKAFTDYMEENRIKPLEVKEFGNVSGYGVIGKANNQKVIIGNAKILKSFQIENPYKEDENELAKKGNSIVYVVQDKEIIALIGVNDIIRKNAKEVIEKLNKNKIDTIMLTGDNKETAETIAKEIGIGKVIANVVPSEKTQVIKELKKQSKNVMMCGDGINDSPALATADIGVSVKSGTDIAMDSSDVILTRNNLDCILTLIHISKSTMKIIKQNLFWAFFYNILMIPIAIGILKPVGIVINPMIASLAMVISSLTVILNTLRLRKK
ncbi:MAG TPA: copper-translocating P-type ATPase [Candidatus Merdicola faecigallinarum]|uniref:P-type Cu(+) transporter n=1 Tax=Candidatus Merdicola faecigallinarum TaxID=2840862 RepID=A0A9D1S922_9FIRM|nr:copper-translocating P-type ATPase [Candidatus Merdicola faecigallinarum]